MFLSWQNILFKSSLQILFSENARKTVDLVFLFDGSASMSEDEFMKNKDFIVDIMTTFQNTSIKVTALLQHETFQNIYLLNYIFRTGYKYCIMLSVFSSLQQFSSPQITRRFLTSMTINMVLLLKNLGKNPRWRVSPTHIKPSVLHCKFSYITHEVLKVFNLKITVAERKTINNKNCPVPQSDWLKW